MARRVVSIGDVEIGDGRPLALIAGPCVIESEELILEVAGRVSELAADLEMPFVFKSSYLKDNRLSPGSHAGPGLESGLRALGRVRSELGVPVLSDVHERDEVGPASEVLDAI
ncbi:MAG: 3-deoxy-8-phosphooctulonate synthase, partial [Candidatus Eisenbacteria sp.]|nr:3-deoxy-8-phosphooctulonate synthase [Candidatus Eisenbacteria bacterium]